MGLLDLLKKIGRIFPKKKHEIEKNFILKEIEFIQGSIVSLEEEIRKMQETPVERTYKISSLEKYREKVYSVTEDNYNNPRYLQKLLIYIRCL